MFVKGAPERVLAMCDWGDDSDEREASQKVEEMHQLAESMGQQGYRVLALAEGTAPGTTRSSTSPSGTIQSDLLRICGDDRPVAARSA